MSEENIKEVYYDQYCKNCKNWPVEEFKDPCDECLHNPFMENSHKPLHFEKKE